MKTFIASIFLSLCMILSTQAQNGTPAKAQSQAEEFSLRTGTLIKKAFVPVGRMKGVEMEVLVFTDLISGKSQKALRMKYEHRGKYSTSTKSAVLDADEVESLLKSISILQEKVFTSTELNYTEVTFKARGGFEAGAFLSKGNWSTYLKLERFDKDSYVFLKQEDFETLKGMLKTALTKMGS